MAASAACYNQSESRARANASPPKYVSSKTCKTRDMYISIRDFPPLFLISRRQPPSDTSQKCQDPTRTVQQVSMDLKGTGTSTGWSDHANHRRYFLDVAPGARNALGRWAELLAVLAEKPHEVGQ